MVLALSIAVTLLSAVLFFSEFFDGWADFRANLSRHAPEDGRTRFGNDPEGADDNGFARLKVFLYFALVLGSGLAVYAFFRFYFGPEI